MPYIRKKYLISNAYAISRHIKTVCLFFCISGAVSPVWAELAFQEMSYRSVAQEVTLDGKVEAVKQATISAQTSARIKDIMFDVNDFVPKGSVILRFRDSQQQAKLKAAQAGVKEADVRLSEAQKEFKRVQEVFAKQLVAKSALDKAEADFAAATEKRTVSQAQVLQAEEEVQNTVIRAPYDGIVTKRHIEVGELAKTGQPLISGFSLDELRVTVDVPQNLINALRAEQKARIVLAGTTEKSVAASRLTIYPFADEKSHTFRVRVYFTGDLPGLYPGMFTKVAFVIAEKQVLTVPRSAVVQRSEITGVYVKSADDSLRLRQIRSGRDLGDSVEVLAGLKAGEKVALEPIKAGIKRKEQSDKDS